jgi:hypothetical protein
MGIHQALNPGAPDLFIADKKTDSLCISLCGVDAPLGFKDDLMSRYAVHALYTDRKAIVDISCWLKINALTSRGQIGTQFPAQNPGQHPGQGLSPAIQFSQRQAMFVFPDQDLRPVQIIGYLYMKVHTHRRGLAGMHGLRGRLGIEQIEPGWGCGRAAGGHSEQPKQDESPIFHCSPLVHDMSFHLCALLLPDLKMVFRAAADGL